MNELQSRNHTKNEKYNPNNVHKRHGAWGVSWDLRDRQDSVCVPLGTPLTCMALIGQCCSIETLGRHFLRNFSAVSATLALTTCQPRVVCRRLLPNFFFLLDHILCSRNTPYAMKIALESKSEQPCVLLYLALVGSCATFMCFEINLLVRWFKVW